MTPEERRHLLRRGLRFEALTIAWNVAEAASAIFFGWLAGSVALVAFGLDSVLETLSAGTLYHQLGVELRAGSSLDDSSLSRLPALTAQPVERPWSFLKKRAWGDRVIDVNHYCSFTRSGRARRELSERSDNLGDASDGLLADSLDRK